MDSKGFSAALRAASTSSTCCTWSPWKRSFSLTSLWGTSDVNFDAHATVYEWIMGLPQ